MSEAANNIETKNSLEFASEQDAHKHLFELRAGGRATEKLFDKEDDTPARNHSPNPHQADWNAYQAQFPMTVTIQGKPLDLTWKDTPVNGEIPYPGTPLNDTIDALDSFISQSNLAEASRANLLPPVKEIRGHVEEATGQFNMFGKD